MLALFIYVNKNHRLYKRWLYMKNLLIMAERVGFEPTAPCGVTGFQDQLLKPLGHLSIMVYYSRFVLKCATIEYR